MTFDEIVAVKDFRKKKELPIGSAHSSDADKMPAINNGTSPDKTKSTSPVKRDLQSNHLNSYTDITDQVFGDLYKNHFHLGKTVTTLKCLQIEMHEIMCHRY